MSSTTSTAGSFDSFVARRHDDLLKDYYSGILLKDLAHKYGYSTYQSIRSKLYKLRKARNLKPRGHENKSATKK